MLDGVWIYWILAGALFALTVLALLYSERNRRLREVGRNLSKEVHRFLYSNNSSLKSKIHVASDVQMGWINLTIDVAPDVEDSRRAFFGSLVEFRVREFLVGTRFGTRYRVRYYIVPRREGGAE